MLLNGWLNERLFRYDVLAEHASREEYLPLVHREHWPLLGIGVASAAVQMIPFVNLLAPVWTGLTFIHYGLARLEASRAEVVTASSVFITPWGNRLFFDCDLHNFIEADLFSSESKRLLYQSFVDSQGGLKDGYNVDVIRVVRFGAQARIRFDRLGWRSIHSGLAIVLAVLNLAQ